MVNFTKITMKRKLYGYSPVAGFTFRVTKEIAELLEQFEELRRLEGCTKGELLIKAIKEYVKRHSKGNPQLRLAPKPDTHIPTGVMDIFPVERRRKRIKELEEFIKANSGRPLAWFRNIFAKHSGLREETIRGYFRLLEGSGSIRVIGSRVYHKEKLPER